MAWRDVFQSPGKLGADTHPAHLGFEGRADRLGHVARPRAVEPNYQAIPRNHHRLESADRDLGPHGATKHHRQVAHARQRLADWLRAHQVTEVDVCGIATDYCVRATALDAAREGFSTRLLTRMCAGVAPETTSAALAEMAEAGVELS